MNRAQWRLVSWLLPLLVLLALWYFFQRPEAPPPQNRPPGSAPDAYVHLRWGNPSGATEDPAARDNFLMKKKFFALSYNNTKGTPNWVSWRVVREDLGNAPRVQFVADPDLPAGFKRIANSDYNDSGFDRGHMCPHGDRQSDAEASKATFVMTNVVPQSANNNEKGWERFESYCRTLVKQGKELYVVAGPYGEGGESRGQARSVIHAKDGDIVVPAKTWKVVMALDAGTGVPGRDTRLLAVVMPNDDTVGDDWRRYETSVGAVEKLTGYTFFDKADPQIIGPPKGRVDAGP